MPADRHGWNDLEHYIGIHFSCLSDFEHFILDDGVIIAIAGPDTVTVSGRLRCQDGIYLDVRKILELNERNQVRTSKYKYHAGIAGEGSRPLFRYDNAHGYGRAGHVDNHHKHVFDETGKESRDPEWIGRDRWPTMREVIVELEEWWLSHQHSDECSS